MSWDTRFHEVKLLRGICNCLFQRSKIEIRKGFAQFLLECLLQIVEVEQLITVLTKSPLTLKFVAFGLHLGLHVGQGGLRLLQSLVGSTGVDLRFCDLPFLLAIYQKQT